MITKNKKLTLLANQITKNYENKQTTTKINCLTKTNYELKQQNPHTAQYFFS